ncbi:MAG: sulfotransferase [Proteobacteria bacterium]|nr:sulfotransferase [Pseudomonadota bacterium]
MSEAVQVRMSERYPRPAWVRRLNAMGDSLGDPLAGARELVPMDAGTLLEAGAGAHPGLELGDPRWRERFEAVVAAANAAPLHVVGRLLTKQELARSLRTRVSLARATAEAPQLAAAPVAAPLFVTGPARSGTTILFELLALDPTVRAPLAWEAIHPTAAPGLEDEERRRLVAECEQELWADVQPEFAAIHELRADLPVECVTLTAACFCGPHWPMVLPGAEMDVPVFYDFHRRMLQVLQHGRPERTWLLKTPSHLATLGALFESYPDAWVIQTHRDPAKTMPSTVSTTAMVQWLRTDAVDTAVLRAAIEAVFGAALNAVAEQRAAEAYPDRFVDVHFQDLMKDPVETVRRAYATMGRAFDDEHARRIRRYLDEKPRGKFGVHSYTAEEWGFDTHALRERLAPYLDHFGVALED